ncbi:MAG TPA: hypothetical protein DDX98_13050 [Bacteroidales bacterium]|jgi:hypothetical protein|nr:hypothetical protein [Bacteroidales bacterium]
MSNTDILYIYNPYLFSIFGIVIEVIGAGYLSIEAFGRDNLTNLELKFSRFSKWIKGSRGLLVSIILIILSIPTIGMFLGNKTMIGLTIPVCFFLAAFGILLDYPFSVNKLQGNTKIGPKGFLLLLIGNILQLIKIIIDIPN